MTGTPEDDGPHPHALFLLYPAFGHTLQMLPVITELIRRGCRVTATTGQRFADRVRSTGAEIATYTTHLSTGAPPDRLTSGELAERTLLHLEEILAISPVAEKACPEPPDVVVFDTTLWAPGRVLAAHWDRAGVHMIPTFASNEHFSVAEKLGELAPRIDPTHPALVRFGERLAEYAGEHGLSGTRVGEAMAGGRDELNIVSIPRAFQVFGETFGEDHIFVGPCLQETAQDTWRPPGGNPPIVLITLGTTVNEQPELFRQCVRAFTGTEWHAVMALGSGIDAGDLGPLPSNVEAHSWITLGSVLPHASVFVCQGGMGSVQESLHHGTPMVVIPHHPEQRANAERVSELGLGHVLHRETVSARLIREAVTDVAADNEIRARVQLMCDHIRASGGAARAAAEIHARALTSIG